MRHLNTYENDLINKWLETNETTVLKDMERTKSITKPFYNGYLTTANSIGTNGTTVQNVFWNEMARRRDQKLAKRLLNKDITADQFKQMISGDYHE